MERRSKDTLTSADPPNYEQNKSLVFLHPDLGIGGAERLVVDAAVGLQSLGHKVTIFTSYRNTDHCFDEARDGTLDVRVRGDWLFPATVLGRLKILCSILRQIHLILSITWTGELAKLKPTAFILDQLSAGVPFLRWFWEDQRILFYCHFPDLLLVQGRARWYKKIWRIVFDWWEGWGIRGADRIVANSAYTKHVVESVWTNLGGKLGVGIVYPCVHAESREKEFLSHENGGAFSKNKKIILSINRFERKKDVGLAIKAFARLDARVRATSRLVLAGGYDTKVRENANCLQELETLADSLKLKHATTKNVVSASSIPDDIEVLFLLSVPGQVKSSLLNIAKLLVYTPSNEHFGIVPLEAMLAGVPVLAADSGGPLETILDSETGWLRSVNKIDQWTEVMHQVLSEMPEARLKQIGEAGKKRAIEDFSEKKLARRLDEELDDMIKRPRVQATELGDVALSIPILGCCVFAIGAVFRAWGNTTDIHNLEIILGCMLLLVASTGIVTVIWRLMLHESAFR